MKSLAILPLAALVTLSTAAQAEEIRLRVTNQNLKGTATLVNEIQQGGVKFVQLKMELTDNSGRKVTVVQESTYERSGRPIRKSQTTMLDGGKSKQSVFVEFTTTKAKITAEAGGKTLETEVEIPREVRPRMNATPEFWFIRDQVTPGGETMYYRFDLSSQRFLETKCIYHGRRPVTVAGRKFNAHLVIMGPIRIYADDQGNPLRLSGDGFTMERIF